MTSHIDSIVSLLKTALSITTVDHVSGTYTTFTSVPLGANNKRAFVEPVGFTGDNPQANLSRQSFKVSLEADSIDKLEDLVNAVLKLPHTYTLAATTPYMMDVYEGNHYAKNGGDWCTSVFLQTFWRLA
jgi:hypothetical protein